MTLSEASRKTVLIVDDDRDIADLVESILSDEGFRVSSLYDVDSVAAVLDSLEPDCVLLDGGRPATYGPSWALAARLATRSRPIPTVMLTAHTADREEAMVDESLRAHAARFTAVIPKPFDIDHLITVVRRALGEPVPVLSDRGEQYDAKALIDSLRAAGAQDLAASTLGRVWVTFRAGADRALYKVYRWRAADVWFVGRYERGGRQMEPLAEFVTLTAVIAFCVARITHTTGDATH